MTMIWTFVCFLSYLIWIESSVEVDAECDIEALRCDVICFFPHLSHHCSTCGIRRPMRFGKRAHDFNPKRNSGTGNFLVGSSSFNLGTDPSTKVLKDSRGEKSIKYTRQPLGEGTISNHNDHFIRTTHIPYYRSLFYDTTKFKDYLEKRLATEKKPMITPVWFDIPRLYKSSKKISESKARVFKRNLSFLTSKEVDTNELISGLKGIMQMKNLPVDPVSYGCHSLL